ncbi:sensor histidine kinase [Solirubrobacter soli]|uniref:sensor histidine kinase n=1 Tax=Solirubrobacter soli TaxID=363832 RepID=UPI000400AE9D|nr:histidine kinase [Solirubrobacter soli]
MAGLVLGLLGAAVILASDHVDHRGLTVVILVGIGAAWVGTGLYAWARRPSNRTGALMTWTGFAWLLNAFVAADEPAVFTVAVLGANLYLAAFVHLLVAYPEGRITRPAHRRLVIAGYVLSIIGPAPFLMFGFDAHCTDCPSSVIQVTDSTTLGTIADGITTGIAIGLVGYLVYILTARWRAAGEARRRSLSPLLWSGVVLMILFVGSIGAQSVAGQQGDVSAVLMLLGQIVFASVPFTFLAGLLRDRVARADALGALLVRLGEAPGIDGLRGLLAEALGDPSLKVLYWVEGCWVKRDGQAAEIPPGRAWTPVELEGQRVGAIVHDRSLRSEPEVLETVAAAAGLALRSERLEAALRRSRARIVEAGLQERRRLERNLHDGAQQRLVALSLSLRIAQNQIAKSPEKAAAMIGAAGEELTLALEELRELARGIHPAVLSDRGLGPAVEALAVRSPLPVQVVEVPGERLPEPVEAAAYFVIAEALTNVAKYANATAATVAVRRLNGHAEVEVRDDGVGGADPGRGSGLRGLADRVGALDGSLALDSPPGSGTTLRAEIPV